jgi:catechol 2,3-dioxygenase-like lactoylglutathione lyase family enzyme
MTGTTKSTADTAVIVSERPSLWHMGLTVSDLKRSLDFYQRVVGLSVEHLQEERSADFDELSANSGTHVKVAWLTDGQVVLQLIEYVAGGDGASRLRHARVGTPHLSFYVRDVDAELARLREIDGIEVPAAVTSMARHGRSFYVYDPDGVPIELWQSVGSPRDRFNRPCYDD